MSKQRCLRRHAGFLQKYLPDVLLQSVKDPRSKQGNRRWGSTVLLRTMLLGLMSGCKGFAETEQLTCELSKGVRRVMSIKRRVPDTTMRDFASKLAVDGALKMLCTVGYDAWRRKALHLHSFDFGILSMDGKYPSIRDVGDHPFLQVHHDEEGNPSHGLLRTMTACLVNAEGRPILGAQPVPGDTNEQGAFQQVFAEMVGIYGPLFTLVMYDAGAASYENTLAVLQAGKDFFVQIADPRWCMYETIQQLTVNKEPDYVEETKLSNTKTLVRKVIVWRNRSHKSRRSQLVWEHVNTAIVVVTEVHEGGIVTETKRRLFVTNKSHDAMSAEKWLQLVVLRWGVETSHQILDTAFEEDKHPWMSSDANGALVMMILRRVAYTLLTLYKSVTLRSEEAHAMPWRQLFAQLRKALTWPVDAIADGLDGRQRRFAVPAAFA